MHDTHRGDGVACAGLEGGGGGRAAGGRACTTARGRGAAVAADGEEGEQREQHHGGDSGGDDTANQRDGRAVVAAAVAGGEAHLQDSPDRELGSRLDLLHTHRGYVTSTVRSIVLPLIINNVSISSNTQM